MTNSQKELVDALVSAIQSNPSYSEYRNFRHYLKTTKQYRLSCILIDNRYLYGSLAKLAHQRVNDVS